MFITSVLYYVSIYYMSVANTSEWLMGKEKKNVLFTYVFSVLSCRRKILRMGWTMC